MDGDGIPSQQGGPIDTDATGSTLLKLDKSGEEMSYKVFLHDIENVVAIHIHLGMPGEVGPHVVTLCGLPTQRVDCADGPGLAVKSSFTSDDFEEVLAGEPMSALVKEMKAGNTYVNVHTTEYPDGETRGQIQVKDGDRKDMREIQNMNKAEKGSAAAIADCDYNHVKKAGFKCTPIAIGEKEFSIRG